MLGDQEIGQVDEIRQGRIEEEVPNKFDIFSSKFDCDSDHILLHQQGCRKQERHRYWRHV